ncbi:MAG: AgmX/PglI C-terminal domain-containing protein [Myxococcota bacterium]
MIALLFACASPEPEAVPPPVAPPPEEPAAPAPVDVPAPVEPAAPVEPVAPVEPAAPVPTKPAASGKEILLRSLTGCETGDCGDPLEGISGVGRPAAPARELPRVTEALPEGTDATVAAVVKKSRARFRYCYERVLHAEEVAGEVEVAWVIEAGKVTRVELSRNTTNEALGDCVKSQARAMRFAPEYTGTASATWTFALPA